MAIEGTKQNPFAFLAYDIMTGNLLEEVPLKNVSVQQRLNTPGTLQGEVDLLDPAVRNKGLGQLLQPGRTAIFMDWDGFLLFGGILWTVDFARSKGDSVPIRCQDFGSYFGSRVQAKDYTNPPAAVHGVTTPFTGWTNFGNLADPMVIAAKVVTDALAVHGSALAAGTGFPLTINQNNGTGTPFGEWVVVSYPATQEQSVLTIVSTLASMGYAAGFDYQFDVAWNGSTPAVTMNMGYPRIGRIASASSVIIDTQRAVDYSYPQDATQMATTVYGIGSGAAIVQAALSNPAPITAGWPLLEQVAQFSNVTSYWTLAAGILGVLGQHSWPVTTPSVTIPLLGDPSPSDYQVGDDVLWVVPPDERFPNGMQSYWRIVGVDYKIADEGMSTATLTFNVPPTTSATEPPT